MVEILDLFHDFPVLIIFPAEHTDHRGLSEGNAYIGDVLELPRTG